MTAIVDMDWLLVRRLQEACGAELASRAATQNLTVDDLRRRGLARQIVASHVSEHARNAVRSGHGMLDHDSERRLQEAVLAGMFGLGRLEPLLEDSSIEDIEISGNDVVWVTDFNGALRRMPPVAESDEELRRLITQLAATAGHRERQLTDANPLMHMRLPNGSRMAANIGVTRRPEITIRNHRLLNVDLQEMARIGTVSESVMHLLAAAVRARLNIIVTGNLGSGKTTLVRALLGEIPREERFATIETAFELQVDQDRDRVVAYEAQPGTGEPDRHGRRAGEVTLHDLIEHALLQHHRRIVLGEIRGREVGAVLEVMQLGEGGSMSTLHARSAMHAVSRLANLVVTRTDVKDHGAALGWVGDAVDLIVHVRRVDAGGTRRRFISHVVALGGYADGRVTADEVVHPGADGVGELSGTFPELLRDLEQFGFEAGRWLRTNTGGL